MVDGTAITGENGARGEHRLTDLNHYLQHPDEFSALIKSAEKGDFSVRQEIRALLDTVPALVPALGDILQQSEQKILDMTLGPNILHREAIKRDLDTHEQRLVEEPTYVETLLIRQIRLDLLSLQMIQQRAEQRRDIHTDKLLNSAHKRFLAAIKTLDQLRKLSPNTRVQIAQNQVNLS
jgi:hypothetical protein